MKASAVNFTRFLGISNFLAVNKQLFAHSYPWAQPRTISLHCTHNTPSENHSDIDMAGYPHDDAEKMAKEQSEKTFKEWEGYWTSPNFDKIGIVDLRQGTSNDWKTNGKQGNSHTEVNAASNSNKTNLKENQRRWVLALRHGERVDLTYGVWAPFCFDKNDKYTRKDLNMPEHLTDRVGGAKAYAVDTPLTRVGQLQARLVGEGLRAARVPVTHVYSSAALRSVATAHHLLQGLEADPSVKVKVEPGLFELKNWHLSNGMPPFMTPLELKKAGYNVNLDYKPYVDLDITTPETLEELYMRNEFVMQSVVKNTEEEGGNIIFVGHAITLEITVKALKRLAEGDKTLANYDLSKDLLRVPYCALGAMKDKPWEVVPPPCPPCINSGSGRFNWKMLLDI